jgi:hypothetical protein
MEQMPGYLAARFIGAGETGGGAQQFVSIAEYCKYTKNTKLLIDTTGFDVKLSAADRFHVGTGLGIFALHGIKVAVVCRPEQLDPGRLVMLVARNRYVSVEVFTDYHAAEEWLLK